MTEAILFEKKGPLGLITLNRPDALNALNLTMIIALQKQLTLWKVDPAVKAVVLQATPGKAFCAGGDIRCLYEEGQKNPKETSQFFWQEYRLNHFIQHFGKPYIALMDGITMGGGVGISLHGSHPVASPRFVFAMPETGIGFFPDIGASHLLMRIPDNAGIYLGLSGDRLGADDALATGLVNAILPSEKMPDFVQALAETDFASVPHTQVDACLETFAIPLAGDQPSRLHPLIRSAFAHPSVEAIIDALSQSENAWAKKALQNLQQKSPLSLKITLTQLLRAQSLTLAECLKMDFGLVNHFIRDHDFYEGVRALLVDKDKMPKWNPATLAAVTEGRVADYFEQDYPELVFD